MTQDRRPSTPEVLPPLPLATRGEIELSKFDADAVRVITRLRQFGHQAYFVGGCVRDLLLDHKPKDFDICTSAHPGEVRSIFRNCRLIGRRFRLAHVYFKGGKIIEVSTFRANPAELETVDAPGGESEEEAETEPNPDANAEAIAAEAEGVVEAVAPAPGEEEDEDEEDFLITHDNVFGTADEDARRRDFTINGLFYDIVEGQVIDYVHGRRDLEERFIRTIGDPERRMREDPVRILRAVRFASKLSFDVESRTYAAMEGAVEDLPRCAPPRLLEETFRLIRGGVAAPSLRLLAALDAVKILLPPVDSFLRERGGEGEKAFYAYAEALDVYVRASPVPVEDAVLLAALLLPISRAAPVATEEPNGQRPTVAQAIEDLLNELVRTARLPRRIAERCRLILIAQRTLSGERKRRGPLSAFRKHPLFAESITVFELMVNATGEYRDELEAWKAGSAPAVRPDAEGTGRRRRRRRGPRSAPAPAQEKPPS